MSVETKIAVPEFGSAAIAEREIETALSARQHSTVAKPVLPISAVLSWVVLALVTLFLPDTGRYPVEGTEFFGGVAAAVSLVLMLIYSFALLGIPAENRWALKASRSLAYWSPWLIFGALWLLVWELTTAKTGLLKPPYFTPPQQLIAEAWKDKELLLASFGNSLMLLAVGFAIGALSGLATGMIMGWSKQANYWLHPVLQYIGPVPTLAWVPIIFVAFPTAYSGAIFLIALSVWFPVAILTRAGISSTPKSYYDVATTLGASNKFLIFKISLKSALPDIFTGLFMALGAAFVTLTVAETFGVNSGLGWYINWRKGWSAFPAMYAAIILMVVFCGGLLSLLLAIRNKALAWQKDLTRW